MGLAVDHIDSDHLHRFVFPFTMFAAHEYEYPMHTLRHEIEDGPLVLCILSVLPQNRRMIFTVRPTHFKLLKMVRPGY